MDGIRVPPSIEHDSLNEIVGGDSDPIPLTGKKSLPRVRADFSSMRHRTNWHVASMCSMAETASLGISSAAGKPAPVALVNSMGDTRKAEPSPDGVPLRESPPVKMGQAALNWVTFSPTVGMLSKNRAAACGVASPSSIRWQSSTVMLEVVRPAKNLEM